MFSCYPWRAHDIPIGVKNIDSLGEFTVSHKCHVAHICTSCTKNKIKEDMETSVLLSTHKELKKACQSYITTSSWLLCEVLRDTWECWRNKWNRWCVQTTLFSFDLIKRINEITGFRLNLYSFFYYYDIFGWFILQSFYSYIYISLFAIRNNRVHTYSRERNESLNDESGGWIKFPGFLYKQIQTNLKQNPRRVRRAE